MNKITYCNNIVGYRPETTFNTDIGWGCMIRAGQMALAHALSRSGVQNVAPYFLQNQKSKLGFQQLAAQIYSADKKVKQWCTSSEVMYSAKVLDSLEGWSIQNIVDSSLVLCRLQDLPFNLVALNLRLGLERIQQEYIELLKVASHNAYFLGILGGRHKHAYYLFNPQHDGGFDYLDPHSLSPPIDQQTNLLTDTWEHIKLKEMCPSLSLIFLYRQGERELFFRSIQKETAGLSLPFIVLEEEMVFDESGIIALDF